MGVEYAFLPNWSAKIEYNYIDYGTRSFNASIATRMPGSPGPDWLLFPECRCRLLSQRVSTSLRPGWTIGSGESPSDAPRRLPKLDMHFVGLVFKEQPIYEQSVARTVREQQEKPTCVWPRQPLKIEQLHCDSFG